MPGGRPTKYEPAFCETVIELAKDGKSPIQMCAHFDISRQTIDNWAVQYPEFLDALTRAKAHAQAWWEDQGTKGMVSDKFNAAVWKTVVQARFRDDYTERRDIEISGPNGGPIETREVSPEKRKAAVAALLARKAKG